MQNLSETQKILIENLSNKNIIFIFSTDVVKNSWIDWIVMNPEISNFNTVSLERFIAWDNFKSDFIKSSQKGKSSVPSLMRKFFVRNLIAENAEQKFLKKVINPVFADSATSFTDWICNILPSLHLWQEKYNAFIKNGSKEAEIQKNDEENQDYMEIYNRYCDFLEKNNMFEPSWIQPDFSGDENKQFIIFYPEIFEDYADYAEIFAETKNIKTINLPEEAEDGSDRPECWKYEDARQEMRRTILQIRKLVHPEEFINSQEDKIGHNTDSIRKIKDSVRWDEIALSVPNLQVYRPYLERELTKYNIPFVIRAGFPLTKNCAGQIFADIYECYEDNFSYDSVRALLQNEYVPWKKKADNGTISTDLNKLKDNLIREGNRMRCICGYSETNGKNIDIWEEALKKVQKDQMEYSFYTRFKENIISLCKAKSFGDIETAWTIFKKEYLDEGAYSKAANDILGHCITKLKEMIQIEKEYAEVNSFNLGNHYEFFLNELNSKTYTPQNKAIGLNIYPYRLTAPAFFKYQFVINASQSNLEVPFKRLSFLTTEKRSVLGLLEEDKKFNASHSFIRLYNQNSRNDVVRFSYCEDSFDGFAIAHTFLNLKKDENPLSELDDYDFYLKEKELLIESGKAVYDEKEQDFNEKYKNLTLTEAQKQNFEKWMETNQENSADYTVTDAVQKKILYTLVENRQKNSHEANRKNLVFTQSDIKKFFPCPRKWLLSSVLKLQEDSLDTDLMKPFDMGNTNHKILEEFMKSYIEKTLPVTNDKNLFDNEEEILNTVKEIARNVINKTQDYSDSPLVTTMLNSQLDLLTETIMNFLHNFCQQRTNKEKKTKSSKTEGFGGYTVKAVESSRDLKGEKYDIYGKIDLILTAPDTFEDVGWTIIDYKNTAVPTKKSITVADNQILDDFQMPTYISLLTQNHPENRSFSKALEKIDYAGFKSITKNESSRAIDNDCINYAPELFSNTMDEFASYLDEFKKAIDEKNLEPKTFRQTKKEENSIKNHFDVQTIETCGSCQFNSICRYNYTVGRRNIKTEEMPEIITTVKNAE